MKYHVTLLFLVPQPLKKKKREQKVKVKTTSAKYLCFTVALTAGVTNKNCVSAFHLSPPWIFKNLAHVPRGKYPVGMQVLGSKSGKRKDP